VNWDLLLIRIRHAKIEPDGPMCQWGGKGLVVIWLACLSSVILSSLDLLSLNRLVSLFVILPSICWFTPGGSIAEKKEREGKRAHAMQHILLFFPIWAAEKIERVGRCGKEK
jgi:hypothetical protein